MSEPASIDTASSHEDLSDSEESEDVEEDPQGDLIQLLKTCRYVLDVYDRHKGQTRKKYQNPLKTYINNYLEVLPDSSIDDHLDLIEDIYEDHLDDILDEHDDWLCNHEKPVVLVYSTEGESKTRKRSRKKRSELHLTTCYLKAAELFDSKFKEPIDKKTGKQHEFLLLPTRIMYHLYALFLNVAEDGQELETLGRHLDKTSSQLGINDGTYVADLEMGRSLFGGNMKESFGKILGLVMQSAQKNGMEIPPEMAGEDGFNLEGLMGMIEKIMSGDVEGGGLIQGMMEDLGKCQDQSQIMETLLNKFKDPTLLGEIKKATNIDLDETKLSEALNNPEFSKKIGSMIGDGMNGIKDVINVEK